MVARAVLAMIASFSVAAACDTSPAADAATAAPSTAPAGTAALAAGPVELTNYRSGISLVIQGRNGQDYAVERFYHDAAVDDHGVIYIRGGAKLALEHNDRNTYVSSSRSPFTECGANGLDGKPNSGDEGLIRYKVDRDQQLGISWSAPFGPYHQPKEVCPAYDKPFAWEDLEYEPGTKALGAVGPKPDANGGSGFYYRGLRDAWGDEWHTLTVADDDQAFQNKDYNRQWSSDGKVFLFVVNPRTPCLSLRTRTPQAQFYTTPAKTHFLPRLHEQTTYLTDGVEIVLTNITNAAPVAYRLDEGQPQRYESPLRSEDLKDGRHVLEYAIEGGPKKTRTIVKNPPSPSAGETHPKILWADEAEWKGIQARLQREPYKPLWDKCRGQSAGHEAVEKRLGRGRRDWVAAALENALVARVEGPQAAAPGAKRSYASYAKQILLDNKLSLDPVGLELLHHTDPIPTAEWNSFGYWVVDEVFDLALGYDLLIGIYRADQAPGGITPIEDLKIRDGLAHWIAVQLQELRGYEGAAHLYRQPDPAPATGMWDTARLCGAAVAAMAMPAYDTPHYGTSGFDGKTRATHPGVPFDGQAFTWKELFLDANQPLSATPKLRRRFDPFDGGLITRDGHWFDRAPYYTTEMMGHSFLILANTAKLSCDKTWPLLEQSFQRAADGTLEGRKINHETDKGPHRYVHVVLVNPRFPRLGAQIRDSLLRQPASAPDGKRNEKAVGPLLSAMNPLGLLWYQDDFDRPRK